MEDKVKKNGLIYTSDLKCVIGIDNSSTEFTGNVPSGPTEIAEEAFSCCSLTKISIPDTVTKVGNSLFCNSTELTTIKLSKNLKQLSSYMFCGCKSLTHIDMPLEVEDFTEGLFAECTNLPEVPFRAGIKTLPEGVIDSCNAITSLVIPDSVTTMMKGAINNCENLTTIVLPASLANYEDGAIAHCPKLSRIRISDTNKNFRTDEDCRNLQKKMGSAYMAIFNVPNRAKGEIPKLNEAQAVPQLPLDEVVDDTDDKEFDIINKEGEDMADITQITTQGMDVINTEPEVQAPNVDEDDVAKRLSEIMGQEKQYSDDNFTIMDIPEATEEEMEAEKLPIVDLPVQESAPEPTPQPTVAAAPSPSGGGNEIQDKVAEIIKDNTSDASVGITNIQVESQDEPAEDAALTGKGVSNAGEDRLAMDDLIFESEKVKQNVISTDAEKERILYVFAESLSQSQFGTDFSSKLVKCAERLAQIHHYTSIFYFHGINVSDANFRGKLKDYTKDKDCVIACSASNLSTISDKVRELSDITGVALDQDELSKQAEYARDPNSPTLKLLIQDIMD